MTFCDAPFWDIAFWDSEDWVRMTSVQVRWQAPQKSTEATASSR